MKKNIKLLGALIMIVSMVMLLAACNGNGDNGAETNSVNREVTIDITGAANGETAPPTQDRDGNAITLPETISTIISTAPSNTEILVALGFGGQIIYADQNSADVAGINPDFAVLDMMALDAEFILDAQPDVVFASVMSRGGGEDPLSAISDAGITVIYIPTSISIAEITEDIRFIAAVMDARDAGETIIADMQSEIDAVRYIGAAIPDEERRTVYFEISPAPWMFSFGSGTFLQEMLEIIGAINIFADQESWFGPSDEQILGANPDVILTSTDWMEDASGEIAARPGWDAITAVQNGDISIIDANSSNRPTHNITRALREMAQAIYPDLFS